MNNRYRFFTKIVRNMSLKKKRNGNELNDNETEAMRYISKHPRCIAGDVASYLNVDKALISRIAQKLQNKGFITSEEGDDRRKKYLSVTDKGLALKLSDQQFEVEYYENIMKDIPADEQDAFFITLEKVYRKSKELRKQER